MVEGCCRARPVSTSAAMTSVVPRLRILAHAGFKARLRYSGFAGRSCSRDLGKRTLASLIFNMILPRFQQEPERQRLFCESIQHTASSRLNVVVRLCVFSKRPGAFCSHSEHIRQALNARNPVSVHKHWAPVGGASKTPLLVRRSRLSERCAMRQAKLRVVWSRPLAPLAAPHGSRHP